MTEKIKTLLNTLSPALVRDVSSELPDVINQLKKQHKEYSLSNYDKLISLPKEVLVNKLLKEVVAKNEAYYELLKQRMV